MIRPLKRLSDETYDLLIIGGGINGVAAAWDAALRGLQVALIDKGDFGAETSSATLKTIHGGLRYLQHLDFIRARESVRERSILLTIAPHIVHPFPFIVPTYGHLMKGKEFMTAGIVMNEIVSFDRNRAIPDPSNRIPDGRVLSRKECLALVPGIKEDGLTGGVMFYDAQMHNSERLTFLFALSAAGKGADLANYVEAVGLLRREGRVTGARAKDRIGGGEFDIRARVVANMTGPWSDITLGLLERPDPPRRVLRSKGIQIVTPALTEDVALAVASKYRDPDALFSRGARHYFITPWRGLSLVGTTDTVYEGDPDEFRITDRDIRDFVDEINEALPSARLSRGQVSFAFGGMRPITEKNVDAGAKAARKYEITDHLADRKVDGLISVVGVKYTTCRLLAEKVVNLVFRKLGRASPPPATATTPLFGGNIERFDRFLDDAVRKPMPGLDAATMTHLACTYGSAMEIIGEWVMAEPALGAKIPGSSEVIRAEVVYAVREECALHLEDVILRRTDIGTLGHPGAAATNACADILAAELGWDAATRQREIAAVEKRYEFRD
jgi:glycerol-3-phosphate dehydrogenase